MAGEHFWTIRVDGTRHEIVAKDKGSGFDVYVDEEFRFRVRSDINLDIEEDLTVGSKRCRIVVYRGVPDLMVDGILLDAEEKFLKEERRSRRQTILGGLFLVALGIFAMWMYVIMTATGEEYGFGIWGPVFALLVTAVGVAVTVCGLRKNRV